MRRNSLPAPVFPSRFIRDTRYEISEPEVMPSSIDVGSESNVMFSIYNTGKTTLYNVSIRFEGDSVSGGEALWNIQSGGTGNVDTMLTGAFPTTDDGIIKAIISLRTTRRMTKTEVEKELDAVRLRTGVMIWI